MDEEDIVVPLPWYKSRNMKPGTTKYRYLVAFFTCMTFVVQFDESTYNLAIPSIMKDLNISSSDAQWLITAFFLGTAAFSVPFSKFGIQVGYVKLTIILLTISFFLYILSYFTKNFYLLVFLRFVIGASTAGIHCIRNSMSALYVEKSYSDQSIKNTLVIKQTLLAVAPIIGSVCIDQFGWRIILIIPSIFCILSVIFVIPMQELKEDTHNTFDLAGTLVLAVMLASFNLCFTFFSTFEYWLSLICAFTVFSTLCLYVQIEDVSSNPITPLWTLKKPISIILVLNFFNYTLQNSISFAFPLIMTYYDISSSVQGLYASLAACCGILATLSTNELTKRFTYRYCYVWYYAFAVVILLVSCFLFNSVAGTITSFVLCDFAAFLLASTSYGEVLITSPHIITPVVAGFPTSTRMIGSSVAYSLSSCLYDIFKGVSEYRFSGEEAILVCQIVFCLFNIAVSYFWLGNGTFEKEKKKYKEDRIIDVILPSFLEDKSFE